MNDYDDAPTNFQGPPPPPNQSPNKDQKTAIAAAAVGTAALGGAAWGMSQFLSDDTTNNTADIEVDHSGDSGQGEGADTNQLGTTTTSDAQLVGNGVGNGANEQDQLVSPIDREDMTFAEAFRDARNEMGPNHYFEWHGHLYNTFYTEEWNAMSHDQQQTFLASVPHDDFPAGHAGDMLAGGEIPTPHHQHHAPNHTPHHSPPMGDDVPDPVEVDDSDIIVEDDHSVHTAANQSSASPSLGHDVDVALVEIDGHAVAVFDDNHDDRPDGMLFLEDHVLVVDTDHDHVLDTRYTYNQETHTFGNGQNIEAEHIAINGSMNVLHNTEHAPEPAMADNHPDDIHMASNDDFDTNLGADFDPNADISDYA